MPLNEPRIYPNRKEWEGLEEMKRDKTHIWFKKRSGYLVVPIKAVEGDK